MEGRWVAPMEVRMEARKVARKVAQMEVLRAGRWVAPMEVLRVDRTEVPKVDRSGVRMEAQKVDRSGVRKVVRMEAQKADRSGVRKVVPRVDWTGERLEGSGWMAEPVEVLPRMQVGGAGVLQRFPLRARVGPRAVLPESRARALPKPQARELPAWKEAVRAGGRQKGLPRVQEEWPRLAPVLGKEEDRSRR